MKLITLEKLLKKEKFAVVDGPFGTQLHASDYTEKGIPVIRIKNIGINKFLFNDLKFIKESKFQELKRSAVYPNDILLAKTGATIGKVCLVPKDIKEGLIASSCAKISIDEQKASLKLISYFLNTNFCYHQIIGKSAGSTRNTINLENIRVIKIPDIPLPTQRKIASILETCESAIEKRKTANRLTDEFLKSTFLEMFGDPIKNQKNVKKLSEICLINPRLDSQISGDMEVSFIPMSAVSEKGIINTEQIKIYDEIKNGFTYFREGDVLFAKITPCMENGKGTIANNLKNGIGFGSTEFHVLRPSKNITSEWIYFLLSFKHIRKIAAINMTGTAGQKRVPVSFLTNLKVSVPPIDLQHQFASLVRKVEKLKEKQRESEKELNNLFNSIMQRAFKGELFNN